jgi:hypothetical protein
VLASRLIGIANLPPGDRPAAASALLARAASWYQDGQLASPAYAAAITTLIDAGGQPPPPTTGKHHGNGHGASGD